MSRGRKITIVTVIIALIISGLLHGWNMFGYPYYESDEGTYISQAWSLVNNGELAPYTYWYDHPPLGWIILAGWAEIFGGDFFYFGNSSVDNMRVFMLIVHLISVLLVFYITKRLTKSNLAALLATIVFSASPVFLYFQRRVLIDNFLSLWILASTAILLVPRLKLRHYAASGLFLGFAMLTKIPAVVFAPALLALVIGQPTKVSLPFRTITWMMTTGLVFLVFIVYAMLRGEFLPDTITGGEHVSFLGGFIFQMTRDAASLPFWQQGSFFSGVFGDWMIKDVGSVIVAVAAIPLSVLVAIKKVEMRYMMFFVLLYVLFLIRGGFISNFHIIPLAPFLCIIFAASTYFVVRGVFYPQTFITKDMLESRREIYITALYSMIVIATAAYFIYFAPTHQFVSDETSHHRESIAWIKENLPSDSHIMLDGHSLIDLWDGNNINEKTFPNADWYYKISRDPQIREDKYRSNWRNIDYILVNHELLKQIKDPEEHKMVRDAYLQSRAIVRWSKGSSAFIDEQEFISTNGDWAMLFQVNNQTRERLLNSWNTYKTNFVFNYGQVIDPSNGVTTSEGQSYSMLRAAWVNDRKAFDGAWLWAQHHFQHRQDDMLFSWKWEGEELVDTGNATDADEDIALALLFAYKIWDDEAYLDSAKLIISDLWERAVVRIDGRYYFLPMVEKSANTGQGYLFNPSYLSPAWYRVFAEVDENETHKWIELADDSYTTLNEIGSSAGNQTYLPKDWLLLNENTGSFSSAAPYFEHDVESYSYDAFRTLWRVAMDFHWNGAPEAEAYLAKVNEYIIPLYQKNGKLPAVLYPSGQVLFSDNSVSVDSGYLAALSAHDDPQIALSFYEKFFDETYDSENFVWKNGSDYYASNWAWFGVGLFNGDLANLWKR